MLTTNRDTGLGPVLDTVMTSTTNARIPVAATERGARITAWIIRHREALIDAVTDTADQPQWTRTRDLITSAIHTAADINLHHTTVNALERRHRHLIHLLDTPADSRPVRNEEFTVLNPTVGRFRPMPPN
ncbi:hypothetical protein ADK67_27900 [Saccharothrix sp. NRRL B-16348]|uniref:hypothetical protein n=1 Tax=Saccharothrix sp. NRRL B-16348 TaxID=1415542 RepID=UPI0006AF2069|nr:hypothetical protein [Saccharothrix sp. NRRL B-16348]KOX21266.1 hypothetical protein ADK67_27900 [Saccharothrix sp. NRRL B-16348]